MNARQPATARTPRLRRILSAAVLTVGLAAAAIAAAGPATGPQQTAITRVVRVGTPVGTDAVARGSSWALPATKSTGRGAVNSLARGSSWS